MKSGICFIVLFLISQFIISQEIIEGIGFGDIKLGLKEDKVIKVLGKDFTLINRKNGAFDYKYKSLNLVVEFDSDSIVWGIRLNPEIDKITSKGLKIYPGLIFKEVEEVYGVGYYAFNPSDSVYFYFDYDIGISFKLKKIFEGNEEIPYRIKEPYITDPRYLSSKVIETNIIESDYEDISENEFIDDVYIPKDINDAVQQINTFFSDSIRNEIKVLSENEFSSEAHLGLGMRLRNNWGLWTGSRLAIYFNNLGISHPDDMSGILLGSYHRYLNEKNLEIDKQIEYYKKYWLVVSPPKEKDFPKGELHLEFDTGIFYNRNDGSYGFIHFQTNSKSDNFWIFDYYYGWKKINKSIQNELIKYDEISQEMVERILKI